MLQSAQAQGTLYLSSLSPTSTGSVAVGSNSWLASFFSTGNSTGGYLLNSVQLAMTDASGSPGGFQVSLYSANALGGVFPGSSLGTLVGSADPATAGTYSYNTASSLALAPSSYYFIVLSASTAVASGAYSWSESAYPPGFTAGGWFTQNGILLSNNGTSGWSPTSYQGIGQFSIFATPAPEPGVLGLFALGGLLVAFQRRKQSTARPNQKSAASANRSAG